MKSIFRFAIAVICVLAFVGSIATAQDLQQQLAKLGHDAAVGYITPILSGWGNDLNSGIYYSADLHDVLGFDVGVKFAMSKFTDADKTYSLSIPSMRIDPSILGITIAGNPLPSGYTINLKSGIGGNYPSSVTANSAVGAKDETIIKTTGGTATILDASGNPVSVAGVSTVAVPAGIQILALPGGFDIGSMGVPLAMPQLDLGLPFGLEVMLRYIPTIKTGDVGKFNYMGFGVRYSISQWLPLFPVDIAAHFMTQKLNFKSTTDADIFSAKATAFGLEVSKKLFILTLYGGFQIESSTLTLADFQGFEPTTQTTVTVPGFEVKGSDKSRFTVGARVLLLFINVHAEYSIAKNPVIALGVGISLR